MSHHASPGAASGSGPRLSRPAVVSLGVSACLLGAVFVPVLPLVVVGVCVWWLTDDLARDPSRRPGWLGWLSLGLFAASAAVTVGIGLILDAHFDCGGTLGGFGEAADARLDDACFGNSLWRPIVGVTLTLLVTGFAVYRVGVSHESASPLVVASRTYGMAFGVIAGIAVVLALV